MKSVYKYVSGVALAGLLSAAFIEPAAAQRGFHGGGHISLGFGGGFRAGGLGIGVGVGGYRGGFYGYNAFGYPGLGYRLGVLPFGYYPFYWGSDLYYYYGGTFYRPYDGGGYAVAAPPVGAAVPELPKGSQPIAINGQQFYEFHGVYYREVTNDKGEKMYEVAGKDGVLNTDGDNDNGNVDNGQEQRPQVGDMTDQLPEGSRRVTLNGKKYFVSPDDIYFEQITDKNGNKTYRVVSVPSEEPDQHQN